MKLRTNKNSIRLRLSQSEVEEFKKNGVVNESLAFSGIANHQLCYSLIQAEHESISVSYLNDHLRVYVPTHIAHSWCETDQIGFDCTISLTDNDNLYILVEKDFKCLQSRMDEDESDNFPNPNSDAC